MNSLTFTEEQIESILELANHRYDRYTSTFEYIFHFKDKEKKVYDATFVKIEKLLKKKFTTELVLPEEGEEDVFLDIFYGSRLKDTEYVEEVISNYFVEAVRAERNPDYFKVEDTPAVKKLKCEIKELKKYARELEVKLAKYEGKE